MKESQPVNQKRPFKKRKCSDCCATIRQQRLCHSLDSVAKAKWDRTAAVEKRQYYKEQKEIRMGRRPDMGAAHLEMGEEQSDKTVKEEIDLYIPYKRCKLEGPDGANKFWTESDYEKEWKRLIHECPEQPKLFARNQWLIGSFYGVEVRQGQERKFGHALKRAKEVNDPDDLSLLMQDVVEWMSKYARMNTIQTQIIQLAIVTVHDFLDVEKEIDVTQTRYTQTLIRQLAAAMREEYYFTQQLLDASWGKEKASAAEEAALVPDPPTMRFMTKRWQAERTKQLSYITTYLATQTQKVESLIEDAADNLLEELEEEDKEELNAGFKRMRAALKKVEEAAKSTTDNINAMTITNHASYKKVTVDVPAIRRLRRTGAPSFLEITMSAFVKDTKAAQPIICRFSAPSSSFYFL